MEVASWNGHVGQYDLAIVAADSILPDPFEPNDSFDFAHDLGDLTEPAAWTGWTLHDHADVDFFRFEVLPDGDDYRMEVGFSDDRADFQAALYDADQKLVGFSGWPGGDARIGLQGLLPGTYYLEVRSPSGHVGHYDVAVLAAAPILPDAFEGDELLGIDTEGDDWSLTVSTAGWDLGEHTLFARAQDNDGAWSEWAGTTLRVQGVPDDVAPQVTSVLVRGDAWKPDVLDFLDSSALGHAEFAELGYRIPAGDAQLDPLPWANLDTIAVTFNADVSVSAEDLGVGGINVPHYAVATDDFAYDPATFTATWTL